MPKQPRDGSFVSSAANDYVRNEFDRAIIEQFKRDYFPDQRLAYLGLPGESLLDVLSWREFIGRWTAVQIADTPENASVADRIVQNVLLNQMERGFHLERADIDELLISEAGSPHLQWPFQILNLDYYGGLISAAHRLDALRSLFSRQFGASFLLFLTLNLRDNDHGELSALVDAVEEELIALELSGVGPCFEAHRALGHAGELKIYVPNFLGATAIRHTLAFFPPVLYQGTRPMMHFAVRCTPYSTLSTGRVFGTSERVSFINLPLLLLHDGSDLKKHQICEIHM